MKILNPCAYYDPEQMASSHLARDMEDAFVDAGYAVDVVTPTPTRGIDGGIRDEYKSKKLEHKHGGKVTVKRFSLMREGTNPITRIMRYILCNVIEYGEAKKIKDADVILGVSTPPTQGLLCAKLKKKLKIPFVYNLQDIFPDFMVNTGFMKEGSLLWKIGRKIEDRTYAADVITVISDGFKDNLLKKGVDAGKIRVIPNWVDVNEVVPIDRADNILFDRYSLDRSKFYICYSGNIGHSQNMEMLLDTAKQLSEGYPQIHFVLIGEGAAKEHIAKLSEEMGLSNVTVLPFQPYEEISYVFSLGDAGLIISKAGVGNNSVPSKTWSIMSAGTPVLASFDRGGFFDEIISTADCGICVDADDAKQFKDAVVSLYTDREKLASYGKNGRRYVVEHLSREQAVAQWVDVINKAVSK